MKLRSKKNFGKYGIASCATAGLLIMLFGVNAKFAEAVEATEDVVEATEDPGNLMKDAKIDLSFRYRYEYVDQEGISDEAKASTVRSRLSLQSGRYRNFDFFVEVDDVHEVGADNFNAGAGNTPNRTQYPVVADPEGTASNVKTLQPFGGCMLLGRIEVPFFVLISVISSLGLS